MPLGMVGTPSTTRRPRKNVGLVHRWLLGVINDECFDGAIGRFHLRPNSPASRCDPLGPSNALRDLV